MTFINSQNSQRTRQDSRSAILQVENLHHRYGNLVVLERIDVSFQPGQRAGIVGENGSGKSTLLRLFAGVEDHSGGTIRRPDDIGYLPQTMGAPPDATIETIRLAALEPSLTQRARITNLAEEIAHSTSSPFEPELSVSATSASHSHSNAYARLLAEAERDNLWNSEAHADLVLAHLGLSTIDYTRPVSTLSGGEQARLALAALLIRRPAVLILDEPTNHLDNAALSFITKELCEFQGIVALASHDRIFLDDVCTDIVDLDPVRPAQTTGGARRYGGPFRYYLHERNIERRQWEVQYAREQAELRDLQTSVDETARNVGHDREMPDRNTMAFGKVGNRVEQKIARRVRNAQLRLDTLTREQVAAPPPTLQFTLPQQSATPPGDDLLTASSIQIAGRLAPVSFTVQRGDHLLITGSNGTGKSTLLSVLLGRLTPEHGHFQRAPGIRLAILDQEIVFPNPNVTATQIFDALRAVHAGDGTTVTEHPSAVDLGLLRPRDQDRPVGTLSTGQRRRIALALIVANPPDILLLDEPTNHLSPGLAEELELALAATHLTVVLASHDRWLCSTWPVTKRLELLKR